jgi:hypothetical protein
MAWVTAMVELPFAYSAGPAGAVGKALGTSAVGGVTFDLKVEVEVDQECKIRSWTPMPVATPGYSMRVTGAPAITALRSQFDKQGCADSNGKRNSCDKLEVTATWVIETISLSLPMWTPWGGVSTVALTSPTQTTVELILTIFPYGQGKPAKRVRALVDGVLQFDHT